MPKQKVGAIEMDAKGKAEKEVAAYEKGPLEDLTVQDAMTIIAICTAQIDPEDCEGDIDRIKNIIEKYPPFAETKDIVSRINLYINTMRSVTPLHALDQARMALNPEQKQIAFEIAARVVISDNTLTEEGKRILHTITSKLPVDGRFAKKTIENVKLN
jgi:hypothetical protein